MGKKIDAKDHRCNKRRPLQDIIPLPAPMAVYIEPTNLCNFKCSFCPTSDSELLDKVKRPRATMDMDLFKKIVDELATFNRKINLVNLYKDGEPLLNKNFSAMVEYVKKSGITDRIWTKTNGSLLSPETNRKIVNAGLTWIGISIEAVSAEGYRKIAGVDINYQKLINNIRDLHQCSGDCEIYVKIVNYGQDQSEIDKFYDDFQGICDSCAVENLMGWSNSGMKDFTLGIDFDTYDGLPFTEKEVCPYPFYVAAINADGSVSLCGNDWSHQTVVGNVKENTLQEIWNGEKLFQFRKMLLEGRRKENAACGNCYYLKIAPDNIDSYKEAVLEKLTEERQKNKA